MAKKRNKIVRAYKKARRTYRKVKCAVKTGADTFRFVVNKDKKAEARLRRKFGL